MGVQRADALARLNMAGELLAVAAQQEAPQIDEIPSCDCIVSTRTPVVRSPRYALIYVSYSDGTPSPSSSYITPRKAPVASVPARPYGLLRVPRPGRLQPLPAPQRQRSHPLGRAPPAPAMPAITFELVQRAGALAVEVVDRRPPQAPPPTSVDERITAALTNIDRPLQFSELRALCRVRTATLYERLAALTTEGRLVRSDGGYRLGRS
jgi:hypothetical protein